ncbi:type II toxin-antitoxin system VapC family toxin [Gloeobacter morelensis]|uniref:Ribonuclease VapC n=1 Tax=Gloeobacter morelensis MG652769 TaxID=2781736 RepID=A0ABY3PH72_9CYAN|nr:type II toxin-antitoxin system VapC family toxin [Gloeobacter morelensis]UFP92989.1 type II toxin-antitoxin system VapC family toxin [Gloeobacter morelensis MG652769]
MRLLLDTCVIAELRKPRPEPTVVDTIGAVADDNLYLSVLTVGEIFKGIGLLPPGTKKQELNHWLLGLQVQFAERILAVDAETAEIWGKGVAAATQAGVTVPTIDSLIAATAARHGLAVATRNVRHFHRFGVSVVNPWDGQNAP